MSFISSILVLILSSYVSVTNNVAEQVSQWFLSEEVSTLVEEENDLKALPSHFGNLIPDILRTNAAYQQAALSASADPADATVSDPTAALVNIFCTFINPDFIRTTTGSGFFIDDDGVILTNAHIAQFLLMEASDDFGETECVVRTGNPATAQYEAELLYISPAWIQANAHTFSQAVPMGTGERDYALLYVDRTIDGSPLPAVFPSLSVDTELLPTSIKEATVTAAGYPADALIEEGSRAELLPRQAETTVSELYTFGSNYADVFSIRGSVVGAQGASGGPVVNSEGEVIGLITTRGDDEVDGAGSLRAITLSYIERTITEETGFTLTENTSGNLPERSHIFTETISPFLLQILEQNN